MLVQCFNYIFHMQNISESQIFHTTKSDLAIQVWTISHFHFHGKFFTVRQNFAKVHTVSLTHFWQIFVKVTIFLAKIS